MCFRLHLHHAQLVFECSSPYPSCSSENFLVCVWIMLFVFNDFCYVVCVFMFALCCLPLLFCSCFASCFAFCYFTVVFCILLALYWCALSKCSIFCDPLFPFCVLLKHFSLWCFHSIEAFLPLLKHFTLWCLCFMFCEVLCCNIFHFGGCASYSIDCVPSPCAL